MRFGRRSSDRRRSTCRSRPGAPARSAGWPSGRSRSELAKGRQDREDLAARDVRVEIRDEAAPGGQRQETVLASSLEVRGERSTERADRVELIQVDAAPDVASTRPDVPGFHRHGPHDFARDPRAELVDVRLLDVLIHARIGEVKLTAIWSAIVRVVLNSGVGRTGVPADNRWNKFGLRDRR